MSEVLEGQIVVEYVAATVTIRQAPPVSFISLELVQNADPLQLRVQGNRIVLGGGQVEYRIVGWDAVQSCLIAERTS